VTVKQFQKSPPAFTPKNPRVVGERYWVKCEGFRCMATADYEGKWKIFPSGKELTSTVLSFWQ